MTTGPTRPSEPPGQSPHHQSPQHQPPQQPGQQPVPPGQPVGPPPTAQPPAAQQSAAFPPGGGHRAGTPAQSPSQSPSGAATVLGIGVGLFGTGIGLAVLIGGSGLFLDAAPPPDLDLTRRAALGLVLFIIGAVVLVAVMATGLIAPSAPIVGGVVATLFGLIGALSVYVEQILARVMDTVGLPDIAQAYITNWVVTGAALTIGLLMLVGGLVISATRRRVAGHTQSGPTQSGPTHSGPVYPDHSHRGPATGPAYGQQPFGPQFGQPGGPPPPTGPPRQAPGDQPPQGPPPTR